MSFSVRDEKGIRGLFSSTLPPPSPHSPSGKEKYLLKGKESLRVLPSKDNFVDYQSLTHHIELLKRTTGKLLQVVCISEMFIHRLYKVLTLKSILLLAGHI